MYIIINIITFASQIKFLAIPPASLTFFTIHPKPQCSMSNANCSEQMLYLLRCALWEEKLDTSRFDEQTDWQGIMGKAGKHTVHALVAQQIKRVAEAQNNEPLVAACIRVLMQASQSNQLVNNVLKRLSHTIRQCGFPAMLLKGQGVARYYQQPDLRVCGDIDYYTGKQTDEITERLAKEIDGLEIHTGGNRAKHRNAGLNGVEIELHYHTFCPSKREIAEKVDAWSDDELAHHTRTMMLGDTEVTVPSASFDAVYIFIHLYFHFLSEGIGLRQVCDWMRCLHVNRQEISEERVGEWLTRFGLVHAWQLFGLMAVRHLGMPREEMPLYRDRRRRAADRLFLHLMDSSNFGMEMKQIWEKNIPRRFLAHKWYSLKQYTEFYVPRAYLFPRQGVPRLFGYYKRSLRQIMEHH